MKKITDEDLLHQMIEEIDSECVVNLDDDYTEKAYYHNGQYTDYGMDIKKIKGLLDKL